MLVAGFLRIYSSRNLGLVLPVAAIILFCFHIFFLLLDFFARKHLDGVYSILKNKQTIYTLIIFTCELLCMMLVMFFSIGPQLFTLTYIGLFPVVIQFLATFSISIFIFFRFSSQIRRSIIDFFHHTMTESLFFIALLIEVYFLTQWLINIIKQWLPGIAARIGENQIAGNLTFVFILFLFVDLFLFFFSKMSWKTPDFATTAAEKQGKKKTFFSNQLLLSFIISLVFSILILIFFHPGYETNDDMIMIQYLSGFFGGGPSEFSVHSNVILGFLFKALFHVSPTINWVVFFYFITLFFSTVTLIYCLLSVNYHKIYLVLGIAFILITYNYFFLNINFTTTASFASIAGVILLLSGLKLTGKPFIIQFCMSAFLLLAGSLIRLDALLMVLVMISPIFLFLIPKLFSHRNIFAFGLLILVVGSTIIFNRIYINHNPLWNAFTRYVYVNHQLRDTPIHNNMDFQSSWVNSLGWSANDQQLFAYWISLDKNVFSVATMEKIRDTIPHWNYDVKQSLEFFPIILGSRPNRDFLLFSCTITLCLLLGSKERRLAYLAILSLSLFLGIGFILHFGYKFPSRVSIPLICSYTISLLTAPSIMRIQPTGKMLPRRPGFQRIGLVLSLVLLVQSWYLVKQPFDLSKINKMHQETYTEYVSKINELVRMGNISDRSLILAPSVGFPFHYMNPFQLYYPAVDIITGGWNSFSPGYDEMLSNHGFTDDPNTYVDRSDFYLLTSEKLIPNIELFYHEHYALNVHGEIVSYINNDPALLPSGKSIVLYRLIAKKE